MLNYILAHKVELLMILGAVSHLATTLQAVIPAEKTPAWMKELFGWLGSISPEGKFTVPYVPANGKAKITAMLAALGMAAGCACWQPEHKDEPKCVLQHQIVDCNVDAVKDLVPSLLAIVTSALSGGSIDWGTVLHEVEGKGFRDAMCIVAVLQNAFIGPQATANGTETPLSKLKAKRGVFGVKVCIHDGKQKICR